MEYTLIKCKRSVLTRRIKSKFNAIPEKIIHRSIIPNCTINISSQTQLLITTPKNYYMIHKTSNAVFDFLSYLCTQHLSYHNTNCVAIPPKNYLMIDINLAVLFDHLSSLITQYSFVCKTTSLYVSPQNCPVSFDIVFHIICS